MAAIKITYPDGDKAEFPHIASVADEYGSLREQRLAQEKIAAALKERESFLATYLIDNLPKSDATGTAGKSWSVRIVNKVQATVEDWDKYYAFVFKSKRQDLLQRRINETAIKEMWEKKKVVPGIGKIEIPTVSLTKVKT